VEAFHDRCQGPHRCAIQTRGTDSSDQRENEALIPKTWAVAGKGEDANSHGVQLCVPGESAIGGPSQEQARRKIGNNILAQRSQYWFQRGANPNLYAVTCKLGLLDGSLPVLSVRNAVPKFAQLPLSGPAVAPEGRRENFHLRLRVGKSKRAREGERTLEERGRAWVRSHDRGIVNCPIGEGEGVAGQG
jgi:hypothetical protein